MKTPLIKAKKLNNFIVLRYAGHIYKIPLKVAEKYVCKEKDDCISPDDLFAEINAKYTKPGALLRGLRAREGFTQIEMAEKLEVTQSDISQMEKGVRPIGKTIAKRIEKLFDVNYRSFLA